MNFQSVDTLFIIFIISYGCEEGKLSGSPKLKSQGQFKNTFVRENESFH